MNKPVIEYVGGCSYGSGHPDYGVTDIRVRIDRGRETEVLDRILNFIRTLNVELTNE